MNTLMYLRRGLYVFALVAISMVQQQSYTSPIKISEQKLIEWASQENYNRLQISLDELVKSQERAMYDEGFGLQLNARANYQETKEKSFLPFIPVNSPLSDYQLKLSKKSKYGISYGVNVTSNQYSTRANESHQDASLSVYYQDPFASKYALDDFHLNDISGIESAMSEA